MEVKLSPAWSNPLRQLIAWADHGTNKGQAATWTPQARQEVVSRFMAHCLKAHGLEGKQATLLPDATGFQVQDGPGVAPPPKKGG